MVQDALSRFRTFCQFEPETGCVVWTGARTKGRGHHVDYSAFWYNGRKWFGHRWAAQYIHGLDIEAFQVDHCCPHIPIPNTLCVQHLQALTPRDNRELQHTRRKHFIHLQVGLVHYRDLYGHDPELVDPEQDIPFYEPPSWLELTKGTTDGNDDCPF